MCNSHPFIPNRGFARSINSINCTYLDGESFVCEEYSLLTKIPHLKSNDFDKEGIEMTDCLIIGYNDENFDEYEKMIS